MDFELLSEIMKATSTEQAQPVPNGSAVTPGKLGVNPGNQPVMSLFDFAKN